MSSHHKTFHIYTALLNSLNAVHHQANHLFPDSGEVSDFFHTVEGAMQNIQGAENALACLRGRLMEVVERSEQGNTEVKELALYVLDSLTDIEEVGVEGWVRWFEEVLDRKCEEEELRAIEASRREQGVEEEDECERKQAKGNAKWKGKEAEKETENAKEGNERPPSRFSDCGNFYDVRHGRPHRVCGGCARTDEVEAERMEKNREQQITNEILEPAFAEIPDDPDFDIIGVPNSSGTSQDFFSVPKGGPGRTNDVLEPAFADNQDDPDFDIVGVPNSNGTSQVFFSVPKERPDRDRRTVPTTAEAGSFESVLRARENVPTPWPRHVLNTKEGPVTSAVEVGSLMSGRNGRKRIPWTRPTPVRARNEENIPSVSHSAAQPSGTGGQQLEELRKQVQWIEEQSERFREFGQRGGPYTTSPPHSHPHSDSRDSTDPLPPYIYVQTPAGFTIPDQRYGSALTFCSPASVFHFPGGATRDQLWEVLSRPHPNGWRDQDLKPDDDINIIHVRTVLEGRLKDAIARLDRPLVSIMHLDNRVTVQGGLWPTVGQGNTYIVSTPDLDIHGLDKPLSRSEETGSRYTPDFAEAYVRSSMPSMRGGGDTEITTKEKNHWNTPAYVQTLLPAGFTIPKAKNDDNCNAIVFTRPSHVFYFKKVIDEEIFKKNLHYRSWIPRAVDTAAPHYKAWRVKCPQLFRRVQHACALYQTEPAPRRHGYGHWSEWETSGSMYLLSPAEIHHPGLAAVRRGNGKIKAVEASEPGVELTESPIPILRGGAGSERSEKGSKRVAQRTVEAKTTPRVFTWVSEKSCPKTHYGLLLHEYQKLKRKYERARQMVELRDEVLENHYEETLYWYDEAMAASEREETLNLQLADLQGEYDALRDAATRVLHSDGHLIQGLERGLRRAHFDDSHEPHLRGGAGPERTQKPAIVDKSCDTSDLDEYILQQARKQKAPSKPVTVGEGGNAKLHNVVTHQQPPSQEQTPHRPAMVEKSSDSRGLAEDARQQTQMQKQKSARPALKRIPSDFKEWKGLPSPSHIPKNGTRDPKAETGAHRESTSNHVVDAIGFYFFSKVSIVVLLSDPMHFFQWPVPVTLVDIREFLKDRQRRNIEDKAEFVRIREILEARDAQGIADPDVSSGRMVLISMPSPKPPTETDGSEKLADFERLAKKPVPEVPVLQARLSAINLRREENGLPGLDLELQGHSDSEDDTRYQSVGHIINFMNDQVDSSDEFGPENNTNTECSCSECHLHDHFGEPSRPRPTIQHCPPSKSGAPSERGGAGKSADLHYMSSASTLADNTLLSGTLPEMSPSPTRRDLCPESPTLPQCTAEHAIGQGCESWTGHLDTLNDCCTYCHLPMVELEPFHQQSSDSFASITPDNGAPSPLLPTFPRPEWDFCAELEQSMSSSFPPKVCTNPYACPPVQEHDKMFFSDMWSPREGRENSFPYTPPMPKTPSCSPASSTRSSTDCVVGQEDAVRDFRPQAQGARDWYRRQAESDTDTAQLGSQHFNDIDRLKTRIEQLQNHLVGRSIDMVREAEMSEQTEDEISRQDLSKRIARMEDLIHKCLKLARKVDEEKFRNHQNTDTQTSPPGHSDGFETVRFPVQRMQELNLGIPSSSPIIHEEQKKNTKTLSKRTKPFTPAPVPPTEAGPSRPTVYRPMQREDPDDFSDFVCGQYAQKEQSNVYGNRSRGAGIWIN